ncbi:hypothetical protein [Streptomyces sp. NPDC002588]|uniref:hypothetical protein n=1 Tax=Streptomyces sp. NPDC002588 TaxID=3154419 RepID=UPI003331F141
MSATRVIHPGCVLPAPHRTQQLAETSGAFRSAVPDPDVQLVLEERLRDDLPALMTQLGLAPEPARA